MHATSGAGPAIPDTARRVSLLGPWDETSVPHGLLGDHRLAAGRWGLVRAARGRAVVRFAGHDEAVGAGTVVVLPPDTPHRLVLDGPLSVTVEIWEEETQG